MPALALCIVACTGQVVGQVAGVTDGNVTPQPTDPSKASACSSGLVAAHSPVRRLNRWEYNNAVADLLGETANPASVFGAEQEGFGFNNNAEALLTDAALAEKHVLAAEAVSLRAVSDLSRLAWFSCDLAAQTADEARCATQFIEQFALRAFRRPPTDAERAGLLQVFQSGKDARGKDPQGKPLSVFQSGVQLVIESVLVAPAFLYRLESRPGRLDATGPEAPTAVTGYEMASRLSFLLWGSVPDEVLLTAAASSQLVSKEDVARETKRMLAHSNARRMVTQFHSSWLDFDRILSVSKAVAVFPEFSTQTGQDMKRETERFVETAVFEGAGRFSDLLSAPYTVVNGPLATLYGLAVPAPGQWAKADSPERSGLLTQGSLMAFYGHSDQTSPVHRGKLVREVLLCQEIQPPPPNVSTELPPLTAAKTARERFAQHSDSPACRGCHKLMDPIGFGFENFDGIGRYRTLENGVPIDASGALTVTDVDGDFNGVKGLASLLAKSTTARQCYVRQWFRFAYGRGDSEADACNLERLNAAFEQSDGNILRLLAAVTESDTFLFHGDKSP